ncbi:MAG: divalent cation tolerance protein CutA [Bacteroidia bacterium]|nr:divalent cation tolerance protein CutA [Bacteroidia bacterium]
MEKISMINVYIYLNSGEDAEKLTEQLLTRRLAAHASIDRDNNSMQVINGGVKKQLQFVITAQTRALLFNTIVDFVNANHPGDIKIYSLPITQCNEGFSNFIREQTIQQL